MITRMKTSWERTIHASYLGYITQAIVNNYAPLLFLTFARDMGLSLESITLLTTVNFAVQLLVDSVAAKVVDRIGYRPCIVAAHVFAALGLIGMAVLPGLLASPLAGLLAAVVLYAIGGGIIEVLISPIVEACPTEKKEAAMSLLHSFYCWGHVGVVLVSTAFFAIFGTANWRVLACLWAILPGLNALLFTQVPIAQLPSGGETGSLRSLFRQKIFWLLLVLMICAGASEQAMSQWSSAFAESGLHLTKTLGDLAGPCAFAVLMGTSRALYAAFSEKISLRRVMIISAGLCIACYALAVAASSPVLGLIGCALCGFSVGLFWPGTFSIAAKVLPLGGTAMFALLALGGDVGCSAGPTVVGFVAGLCGGSLKAGLTAAMVFPAVMILGLSLLKTDRAE